MARGEWAKRTWKAPNPGLLSVVFVCLILTSCATIEHMLYTYDLLNFHTVKDGVLYRSARSTAADLRIIDGKYGIRSIIDLRGANPDKDWCDEKVEVTQKLQLKRVDMSMSTKRLQHREDLLRLLNAFRDRELPRPILVHCKAGADRTGEAIAIFSLDHLKWSRPKAAGQLHSYFSHFSGGYQAKPCGTALSASPHGFTLSK